MFSGPRNPMVIVKIFHLYCMTLKLKVIVLVHGCGSMTFTFKVMHGVVPYHFFIDFQTSSPRKHRYQHQDYPACFYQKREIAKIYHFRTLPFLCRYSLEDELHEKPNEKCAKMCRRYMQDQLSRDALWTKSVKKLLEKTTGGLQQPPPGLYTWVKGTVK